MRRFAKQLLFFAVSVLALASLTIAWSGKTENNEADVLEAAAVPLLAAALDADNSDLSARAKKKLKVFADRMLALTEL